MATQSPSSESDSAVEDAAHGSGKIPQKAAAGPTAVLVAARHAMRKMGPLRALRVLSNVNQHQGFDCPGCAWPDPASPSAVEFCENGAKAVAAAATKRRITREFFQQWSVASLRGQSDYWMGRQGRLTEPMVLHPDSAHYEPITWSEAHAFVARRLRRLKSPHEAVFYTSGRTSNEAAFLYQLFVRKLGTNNLPDCSNMCHESSGMGLKEVIGVGKGTVTLDDFEKTDLILIIGQNPGTNHPRMLTTLEKAKKSGASIVHINPLPERGLIRFRNPQTLSGFVGRGTMLADVFAQVRINGDVALLKGIMRQILTEEDRRPGQVVNTTFIQERTQGYEAFKADLAGERLSDLASECGVSEPLIRRIAAMVMAARRIIVCWAMGLTQHENAIGNIQSIVNLLLLKGCIGQEGSGVCPVRGHSNVQGDRTMGITPRPAESFLKRLGASCGFEPPGEHGLDTVEAIQAMHAGRVGVFVALGGNLHSAAPDTSFTSEALQRCPLTVHISTTLNRSHVTPGAASLILPCLARTERDEQPGGEQFVSVENSMGIVHASRGSLEPASPHLRSEVAIVAGLAAATLGDKASWAALAQDYDRVRDTIATVIPGFDGYNERVRAQGGFRLPNPAREGRFETRSGKAKFTVHATPQHGLSEGQFMMMTIRSHDQFNTTIYGLDDRYRGISQQRRVVFLNAVDAQEAGLREGDQVDLVSCYAGKERIARGFMVAPYNIPRHCAATYFPEANCLVPIDHTARRSNTPASKSVVISLRRAV